MIRVKWPDTLNKVGATLGILFWFYGIIIWNPVTISCAGISALGFLMTSQTIRQQEQALRMNAEIQRLKEELSKHARS